ncbi:PLP-dependent aminotransferase family protein [Sinorhizobium saheli]|uniref:Aspartate aminotransferase n=1 Tax=Sinorhizobium saheli TaxID=36856 RepID=A0A178XP06_SINSA|nr:PLP-dependent aminotransferase family protein [Sinorhizobium saheli]MQW90346.1 aminotransferase class I/II-fold pyridoxal phosphate-dependent enzyme [Sinorhizobium saheli]OAP36998.1 aspartate aminotransferase [Sinorhizobium saheli]
MVQSEKQAATARAPKMGARRIYEALKDQILSRVYEAGSQLPSSRSLANELHVSRTTVTIAYEQLAAEGFVELRQGARPRVSASQLAQRPRDIKAARQTCGPLSDYGERLLALSPWLDYLPTTLAVDFRYGDLAPSDFPALAWKRAVNSVITQRPGRLAYEDPRGSRRLRQALQGYLWRARTLQCDLEQIIVVNGSQQGLDLCARILLDAGSAFVMENPGYMMARQIFSSTGASAVAVDVDAGGLKTEELSEIDARMAYVTPSHQFPLGGVMPISRRHQLLDWARGHGAYVVEDDYDSEYRYDISPVPPLQSLEDGRNVIYLGTVSKTLSPMMRIGYLVVPQQLQEVFATAKQLIDRHTPMTEQEALASLIESGAYESHVRRVRRFNRERRETLLSALVHAFGKRITIEGADAGLHVVVWFNELPGSTETVLMDAARQLGVGLYGISPLYDPATGATKAPRERLGLVMGYSALSPRQIEKGVQLLAAAVDDLKGARRHAHPAR